MSVHDADPATMDPREFARLVKATSTAELRRLMQGERRSAILDRIFTDMPAVFRADRAGSIDAVIHWSVGDRPGGEADTYELRIAGGTCVLSAAPAHSPKLAMTIGAVDFIRMVTGNANPITLFMTGRLKAKGDLGLAMKIPNLFEVPRP
jgi:putative sterol carrier protein